MEFLAPELPLRDFGSPLDVDGAALAMNSSGGMESGRDVQPGPGRCSPQLVSLPVLQTVADTSKYMVRDLHGVRRCLTSRYLCRWIRHDPLICWCLSGPFIHFASFVHSLVAKEDRATFRHIVHSSDVLRLLLAASVYMSTSRPQQHVRVPKEVASPAPGITCCLMCPCVARAGREPHRSG